MYKLCIKIDKNICIFNISIVVLLREYNGIAKAAVYLYKSYFTHDMERLFNNIKISIF